MLLGMSSSLISDLVRESPQTQSQELFSLAKQTDVSSWLKTVRMRWWNTKASSQCTCNPAPNKASPTDHSETFTVIFAGRDPCGDQFESLSSSPVYFPNALFSASVHFFFLSKHGNIYFTVTLPHINPQAALCITCTGNYSLPKNSNQLSHVCAVGINCSRCADCHK